MSVFDDVTDVFGDLANVVEGGVGTAESAVDFVGNVLEGDIPGATRDAYEFMDNAKDVLEGVRDLGVSIGEIPSRFVDSPILELANSPPIELAQRIIAGMRLTTGSGDPVDGAEFKKAAVLMQEGVELLIDAAPHEDHWDGAASEAYAGRNTMNRVAASAVQVADANIAGFIEDEAHQVLQTRRTLDDIDEYLFQFALSTAWMNAIPGGRAAKLVADSGAAALGLGGAGRTLTSLVTSSIERSEMVREQFEHYHKASGQKPLDETHCDGPFVSAETDRNVKPPRRFGNPEYTVPEPVEPQQYGPPATPYGMGNATTPPASQPGPAPQASTDTPAAVTTQPRHPSSGSAAVRAPVPAPSPPRKSLPTPTPTGPNPTVTPPAAEQPHAPGATPTRASGIGGSAPLATPGRPPSGDDPSEVAQ